MDRASPLERACLKVRLNGSCVIQTRRTCEPDEFWSGELPCANGIKYTIYRRAFQKGRLLPASTELLREQREQATKIPAVSPRQRERFSPAPSPRYPSSPHRTVARSASRRVAHVAVAKTLALDAADQAPNRCAPPTLPQCPPARSTIDARWRW